jgi:hypothetical protein
MKDTKEDLMRKIEQNDPEILGELAEIILATRDKAKYKTINITAPDMKQINKEIRSMLKHED